MQFGGHSVTAGHYLTNLENKLKDPIFYRDIDNFIRSDIDYDVFKAFENIKPLIEMI